MRNYEKESLTEKQVDSLSIFSSKMSTSDVYGGYTTLSIHFKEGLPDHLKSCRFCYAESCSICCNFSEFFTMV